MAAKFKHEALQCELLSANWLKQEPAKRFVYFPDSINIDESLELFYDILYAATNECTQRIRVRGWKYSVWYDNHNFMIATLKNTLHTVGIWLQGMFGTTNYF